MNIFEIIAVLQAALSYLSALVSSFTAQYDIKLIAFLVVIGFGSLAYMHAGARMRN